MPPTFPGEQSMQRNSALVVGLAGLGLGVLVSLVGLNPTHSLRAASNDRYQDYVMCTGAVSINPRLQTDGVWLLDYRSGKLLGSCVDKSTGKIVGWAEVDLATEFDVKPQQDVHFMMTTGYIMQGQSALYVAETTTGKFGVYTMGSGTNGNGIVIRRHDMTGFRVVQPAVQPAAATVPGMPGVPASTVPGQPYVPPPHPVPSIPSVPVPSTIPSVTPPTSAPPTYPQVVVPPYNSNR
jgi:hypothetical protein